MEWERRYIIFKVKDIEAAGLTNEEWEALVSVTKKVTQARLSRGVPGQFQALVVESDWPEFLFVKRAIETRTDLEEKKNG